MAKKLLLVGGGGHCKSVLDSLLKTSQYKDIGIIDKKENIGKAILGVPIIGGDDDLLELFQQGFNYAFVTIGSIGNPAKRIKLFTKIERIGFNIPNICDSTAIISDNVTMTKGIYVGKNVVINTGSTIGEGVIINTSSTVEHDCVIGQFVHIASGSVLCGEVHIGRNTHIGANSVVKQQVKIGSNSLIGMGSVVLHDIGDNKLAYGNPCKEAKDFL